MGIIIEVSCEFITGRTPCQRISGVLVAYSPPFLGFTIIHLESLPNKGYSGLCSFAGKWLFRKDAESGERRISKIFLFTKEKILSDMSRIAVSVKVGYA